MDLNCRPGDIAVVHSMTMTPEANGRVVEVVRRAADIEIINGYRFKCEAPGWVVKGYSIPSRSTTTGMLHYVQIRAIADCCLRPFRDEPGDDVTLTWERPPENREVAP
jgi:hypothetical protein